MKILECFCTRKKPNSNVVSVAAVGETRHPEVKNDCVIRLWCLHFPPSVRQKYLTQLAEEGLSGAQLSGDGSATCADWVELSQHVHFRILGPAPWAVLQGRGTLVLLDFGLQNFPDRSASAASSSWFFKPSLRLWLLNLRVMKVDCFSFGTAMRTRWFF